MTEIKSLADEIRERQQQVREFQKDTQPGKRDKENDVNLGLSPEPDGSMIELILNSGNGEKMANMIHIRLPVKTYRKLIALNAAKITMQKFTVFAINQLLEHPDIKEKLKEVINDMD
ncbi:hypothetical protein [Gaoshiqia sp. Z1-71]|uniref:hypothetical protein n=1 Tax=Gaoshiqia hydrogeniformans TaxID=3290090 RepID=UPI003BF8DF91